MKKAKTIKIFPAPHVEVRIHPSEEMVEDFKECHDTGDLGKFCAACSWFDVEINGAMVCCIESLKKEIRRQLGLEQK